MLHVHKMTHKLQPFELLHQVLCKYCVVKRERRMVSEHMRQREAVSYLWKRLYAIVNRSGLDQSLIICGFDGVTKKISWTS